MSVIDDQVCHVLSSENTHQDVSNGDTVTLSEEQKTELIQLRWIWDRSYYIDCDGVVWTATRLGDPDPAHVLETPGPKQMWKAIFDDDAARATTKPRRWIERASGPPFLVE